MLIKKDIYSVGVMNPQLRVFDIIMQTEYGTSYNSYLIKGSKKTALVETVHTRFFDEFLEYVTKICDVCEIDYLILNHTEPDHTGSVAKLLNLNPNIKVITTMAGKKFVSAISNCDFESQVVKDGDEIDLGDKTLKFIIAPFLHWPDSMMTYCIQDSTLFSCDVFGSHFCEPQVFDSKIHYKEKYESALKYYYDCIFGPFKEHVLYGLDKIKDLKINAICPSHGPVLLHGIDDVISKYKNWSTPVLNESDIKKVVIVYVSAYGCTKAMADHMKDAILSVGNFEIELINAIEYDGNIPEKIHEADAVMFGSPTINKDALKPIWDVISSLDAVNIKAKLCGVFGSYGWSGEAVPALLSRLKILKLNVFGEGVRSNFVPSEQELEKTWQYAVEFAKNI